MDSRGERAQSPDEPENIKKIRRMQKNKNLGINPNQSRINLGRSQASKNIKRDPKQYSRTSKMEGYFDLKCQMGGDRNCPLH